MKVTTKAFFVLGFMVLMALPANAYDSKNNHGKDEKHKSGHHGSGHHGYGISGPPADIPSHIKSRIIVGGDWSTSGTAINLNNSQVGIKGVSFMAKDPELKGVTALALKSNQLGDEG